MSRFALEGVPLASLDPLAAEFRASRRKRAPKVVFWGAFASARPSSERTGGPCGRPRGCRVLHHIAVDQDPAGHRALTLCAEHEHLAAETCELRRPWQLDVCLLLLAGGRLVGELIGDRRAAAHLVADLRFARCPCNTDTNTADGHEPHTGSEQDRRSAGMLHLRWLGYEKTGHGPHGVITEAPHGSLSGSLIGRREAAGSQASRPRPPAESRSRPRRACRWRCRTASR